MQSRIVARLTAPVMVVSAILIIIAFGAAWYVRDSQRNVSFMINSHVASVHAAQELEISLREIHVQFDRYLITGQRSHLDSVPHLRERAQDALQEAWEQATTEEEQRLMKRVQQGYDRFFREYDRYEKVPPPQGRYAGVLELVDNVLTRYILEPAREYLRLNQGALNRATQANQDLSQRLTVGLIGLGVCGSIAGLLGGWVIAVSLRRSLLNTDRVLRDTAAQLGEAAHIASGSSPEGASSTTLQQVTQAAAAVLNRLKQTERDALRAEQLAWVGQMAAGIAHEVRNPLTVIKLLVQAATDPRRSTGFRPRDLHVLEGEILRLEQIISMFLDFARPPRPYKKSVSIVELLKECLSGVRARAELQGVVVKLVVPEDIPVLDVDPGQVQQVLYNLMFNSLDVLASGGSIQVTVLVCEDGDRDRVCIRVADTGPGLPRGLEERIFDPFVSTKETGLGLGLSICRRIVEAHGGSISASNGSLGGAVFEVGLPGAFQSAARERNGILQPHGAK
ncbi:MAG TPA: ATP-binding protein [Gemmata sp.]|nr:ATP-binding protein [Gemmata sp.]